MKTTLDLSDALFHEAKARAASSGQTLRSLVERGLRMALDQDQEATPAYTLRDCSVGGQGLQAGQELLDWPKLRDLAYEPYDQ